MDELSRALPMEPNADGVESREFLFAQYVINRKITGLERPGLLQAIAKNHVVDLFTIDEKFSVPNLRNHGSVEPYEQAYEVFKQSKVNLNITLRSIKSGIPLRCMDIMGSGGFLLSNFQSDFLDFFVPGKDFVYYESKEDLLQKIDYYLRHEDEREEIARSGHDRVAASHTFRHRVREMFRV
jgi:spore maturation protein CgeB